jgi:ABC-2 type transport system ATP-binding protein
MTPELVRVEGLKYSYKNGADALKGLSLSAAKGKITGILGPNGSGKSTLFKILSTQIVPSSGDAWVGEHSVLRNQALVRKSIGVTFQSPSLDPMLTVEENLKVHAALYGLSKTESEQRIGEGLGFLGLEARRKTRIKELSGGLARRAEILKSLLSQPELLILDEPTAGLDPIVREELWAVLRKLVKLGGVSLLVTTHLMDEVDLCDHLILLGEGQVVAQGSPSQLKSEFGADLIEIEVSSADYLDDLRSAFTIEDRIVDEQKIVRIETKRAAELVAHMSPHLGGSIKSLKWGPATLGDVYRRWAGKSL